MALTCALRPGWNSGSGVAVSSYWKKHLNILGVRLLQVFEDRFRWVTLMTRWRHCYCGHLHRIYIVEYFRSSICSFLFHIRARDGRHFVLALFRLLILFHHFQILIVIPMCSVRAKGRGSGTLNGELVALNWAFYDWKYFRGTCFPKDCKLQ